MGDNAVRSEYWVNTSSATWKQTVKQPHKNEQKFAGKNHVASDINPQATNVIYIYMEHPFLMFLDHTQRRSTVGRTPLDE